MQGDPQGGTPPGTPTPAAAVTAEEAVIRLVALETLMAGAQDQLRQTNETNVRLNTQLVNQATEIERLQNPPGHGGHTGGGSGVNTRVLGKPDYFDGAEGKWKDRVGSSSNRDPKESQCEPMQRKRLGRG